MLMFYSNATAYRHYPDPDQYRKLKSRGVKMAVFADEKIPDYLRLDPAVIKFYMKPVYY